MWPDAHPYRLDQATPVGPDDRGPEPTLPTFVTEFATTFVNPLAAILVLVLAIAARRPARVRAGAVALAAFLSLPDLVVATPGEAAWGFAGHAAGVLLQAECALFFAVPAFDAACAVARLLAHVSARIARQIVGRGRARGGDDPGTKRR